MNNNQVVSKKKRIRQSRNKFILSIIILIAAFVLGSFGIYKYFFEDNSYLTPTVKEIIKESKDNPGGNSEVIEPYVNELPGYRQSYNNDYIVAQLKMSSVKIDTLITRAKNNSYYLDHNLYNGYDTMGTPFIDYRNTDLANNRQINIYGHNTQYSQYYDKLPFTNLEAYTDENVFNNYKDVILNTDSGQYKYKVIAVKVVTDVDYEHMKVVFYSDSDWLQHVNKLLSNTMYIDSASANIGVNDKLLVLQACHYDPMGSYILIICKKI